MNKNSKLKPQISVILPVYNREKYIKRAIDSVLNQTFTDWELIIVDDGSTDKTGEICDKYESNDNRITVFHTDNFGVSHARNVGLDAAHGEWIAFLDSDDEYVTDAFETLFEYSKGVDIVVATFKYLPSCKIPSISSLEPISFNAQSDESEEMLVNYFYHIVWGKLYRRSTITHRFYDNLQKCEDSVYAIEAVAQASYIAYVPKPIYLYYEGSELSLNSSFLVSQLQCDRKLYETIASVFTKESMRRWAGTEFVYVCLLFMGCIVFKKGLNRMCREVLISAHWEESIAPVAEHLIHTQLSPKKALIWEAICSGDSGRIIDTFEKHREMFCFSGEMYEGIMPEG